LKCQWTLRTGLGSFIFIWVRNRSLATPYEPPPHHGGSSLSATGDPHSCLAQTCLVSDAPRICPASPMNVLPWNAVRISKSALRLQCEKGVASPGLAFVQVLFRVEPLGTMEPVS
jgi:hypothetical protein